MDDRAWQAMGHQVRRGAQSISILASCTYKAKTRKSELDNHREPAGDEPGAVGDEEEEGKRGSGRRVLRGFRVAHVFDPLSRDLTPGISGSWR
jgi:hypothetical protein